MANSNCLNHTTKLLTKFHIHKSLIIMNHYEPFLGKQYFPFLFKISSYGLNFQKSFLGGYLHGYIINHNSYLYATFQSGFSSCLSCAFYIYISIDYKYIINIFGMDDIRLECTWFIVMSMYTVYSVRKNSINIII